MQEIYPLLMDADMLVMASPIYFPSMSGKLRCAIDRFYACAYPAKPPKLRKVAMLVNSGVPNVYDGAIYSYKEVFVGYLGCRTWASSPPAAPSSSQLDEI